MKFPRTLVALAVTLAVAACGGSPQSDTNTSISDQQKSEIQANTNSQVMALQTDAPAAANSISPDTELKAQNLAARTASPGPGRGFPVLSPWVSFYGDASHMGDLNKAAATFRIFNIDADPDTGNFTPKQIATLKAGGKNRVISYLNLGSCENFRGYWDSVPSGFVSCSANTAAQLGPYQGYSDEVWMNLSNADYQHLMLNYVIPRLVAQGVDGFFLDNMEIVEHGTNTNDGPCDAKCSQGGLDLVRKIRDQYPNMLIVMQNATSDFTRLGVTGGRTFPSLLDGISHEEVFYPHDADAEHQLLNWKGMHLLSGGRAFFIATEDYVGNCSRKAQASSVYSKSRADGFSPYATDASAGQQLVCYWGL